MQKNIIGKTVKAKLPRKQRKYTDKDYAPIEKWIEKKVKDVKFKTLDEFKDFIRKDFVKGKGDKYINSQRGEKLAEKFIEEETAEEQLLKTVDFIKSEEAERAAGGKKRKIIGGGPGRLPPEEPEKEIPKKFEIPLGEFFRNVWESSTVRRIRKMFSRAERKKAEKANAPIDWRKVKRMRRREREGKSSL